MYLLKGTWKSWELIIYNVTKKRSISIMNKKYYTFITRPKNEKLLTINKCMSNWQFKSLPLNNFCFLGERGNTNYRIIENQWQNTIFQNLLKIFKVLVRGKLKALNTFMNKNERMKINELNAQLKNAKTNQK